MKALDGSIKFIVTSQHGQSIEQANPQSIMPARYYWEIRGGKGEIVFEPMMYRYQGSTDDKLIEVCRSSVKFKPEQVF